MLAFELYELQGVKGREEDEWRHLKKKGRKWIFQTLKNGKEDEQK